MQSKRMKYFLVSFDTAQHKNECINVFSAPMQRTLYFRPGVREGHTAHLGAKSCGTQLIGWCKRRESPALSHPLPSGGVAQLVWTPAAQQPPPPPRHLPDAWACTGRLFPMRDVAWSAVLVRFRQTAGDRSEMPRAGRARRQAFSRQRNCTGLFRPDPRCTALRRQAPQSRPKQGFAKTAPVGSAPRENTCGMLCDRPPPTESPRVFFMARPWKNAVLSQGTKAKHFQSTCRWRRRERRRVPPARRRKMPAYPCTWSGSR